jgi:uncharacterized damage-inducible protein DinB
MTGTATNAVSEGLARIIARDLDRLRNEVEAYPSEASLWLASGDIANSGGTLALHLAGNLRHFVGAVLGQDGYVRDRDYEFAARGARRTEILAGIDAAKRVVTRVVSGLTDEELTSPWPGRSPLGDGAPVFDMLLHLSGHLMYHTGQVNYHRRILAAGPGA